MCVAIQRIRTNNKTQKSHKPKSLISIQWNYFRTVFIPIFKMRELKCKTMKQPAQVHTAGKPQISILNTSILALEPAVWTTMLCSHPGRRGHFPSDISVYSKTAIIKMLYEPPPGKRTIRIEFTCNHMDTWKFLSDKDITEKTMPLSITDKPYAKKKKS